MTNTSIDTDALWQRVCDLDQSTSNVLLGMLTSRLLYDDPAGLARLVDEAQAVATP